MLASRSKTESSDRKHKLAQSYKELLDEFANNELKSVGNYTLGRLVGKGSFGRVYLATHKLTNGSKVVLKSARKDDLNLAREIHHHRQFRHPHIARLYEVIVTETLVWLVLEYCPGAELYDYLLKHGPLPIAKVQKVFAQLVGAVCYVHMQSCVHRDLKLENILFDKHENVKLVDFGFTREYDGKANYLQTFCGTVCYSAPEMLKGEKYAGEKVDVWSLGIILYALICGELPFDEDDDNSTRLKILTAEPKWPDHMTADAQALCKLMLSKRTLVRPSLLEVLGHPFLSEHSPAQMAILKINAAVPFSTSLEKDTLLRMKSAGINMDTLMDSVSAQKCDALAGWWALLLEREARKVKRREQKRRERDAEIKSLRRHSAASTRLDRLSFISEDGKLVTGRVRGRPERRASHHGEAGNSELPHLLEHRQTQDANIEPDDTETPPTPLDKDSIRSASRGPVVPPKEGVLRSARSRGSTLHLVTTVDGTANGAALLAIGQVPTNQSTQPDQFSPIAREPSGPPPALNEPGRKVRKRPSQAILAHWKNWTHWFYENTRRARGHNRKGSHSTPDLHDKDASSTNSRPKDNTHVRPHTGKHARTERLSPNQSSGLTIPSHELPVRPITATAAPVGQSGLTQGLERSQMMAPKLNTNINDHDFAAKRQSLSPSPLTPRSNIRHSSGLMGRKSTSSSVSSIRSMHHHHHHTHSKASSTSSANSVSTSLSKLPVQSSHSPQFSHKNLAISLAGSASLPSNIRLVRGKPAPLSLWPLGEAGSGLQPSATAAGNLASRRPALSLEGRLGSGFHYSDQTPPLSSPNPFSSSILFGKKRRNVFKGPGHGSHGSHRHGHGDSQQRSSSHSSANQLGAMGQPSHGDGITIMEEVDEAFYETNFDKLNNDIEEVDAFSPIIGGPGEQVEILEEDDGDADTVKLKRQSTTDDEHD